MTRDEAWKILNIEESKELNHVEILEVCYFSIFNDMIALWVYVQEKYARERRFFLFTI
jgi:hypothetical protein